MQSSDYNENPLDAFAPISTQTWSNGRHKVRCVKVIEETWDGIWWRRSSIARGKESLKYSDESASRGPPQRL